MDINGIANNDDFINDYVFKIRKIVYEDMISYCQSILPYEACGLLSGGDGTGDSLWKLKNESPSPNRFTMSKEEIKKAVTKMNEQGERLSGIFHSHPSTHAFPSSHDIKNNSYIHLAYIIVSFYKGKIEVGCFKTNGKTVNPMKLLIIDE